APPLSSPFPARGGATGRTLPASAASAQDVLPVIWLPLGLTRCEATSSARDDHVACPVETTHPRGLLQAPSILTMRIVQLFLLAGAFAACTSAPHPAPAAARASTPAATVAATVTPAAATAPATPSPSATAAVRYVAIGASDTVGVGASDPATGSWPARVAAFLPPGGAFVNLGVSGSVAAQAKDQQLPGAIAQRPSVVSVWLAVNDMNATIDPASYRSAIGAIVDALVARTEAKIFVGNVPDVRGVPAYKDTDKNALGGQIGAYNDAIASIVGRYPG